MVVSALDAAWGESDSCLAADVQAQLAADGAPFELDEIVAQLRELERHREVRVRRGRLWRVPQ